MWKSESLLKNNRSNRVGDDDIHYFSKIKDLNEKHNQYISRFSNFIIKESSKIIFQMKKFLMLVQELEKFLI